MKRIGTLFVFAAMAACGGGGDSDPTAGEAIEESVEINCAKAHECRDSFPADSGFEFEQVYGDSVDACITNLGQFLDGDDVQASVDAGRIEYDGSAAHECLHFFEDLTCEEFWGDDTEEPQACDDAFVGTVELGGECTTDLDCAEGFCDGTCTDGGV
jgi:hypothetical protein